MIQIALLSIPRKIMRIDDLGVDLLRHVEGRTGITQAFGLVTARSARVNWSDGSAKPWGQASVKITSASVNPSCLMWVTSMPGGRSGEISAGKTWTMSEAQKVPKPLPRGQHVGGRPQDAKAQAAGFAFFLCDGMIRQHFARMGQTGHGVDDRLGAAGGKGGHVLVVRSRRM